MAKKTGLEALDVLGGNGRADGKSIQELCAESGFCQDKVYRLLQLAKARGLLDVTSALRENVAGKRYRATLYTVRTKRGEK